jgi:hypothetical protein
VAGQIEAFIGNSVTNLTPFGPGPGSDLCPPGQAGSTIILNVPAGITIHIKFDGANPGSNANPPYEGPFSLEWAMQ